MDRNQKDKNPPISGDIEGYMAHPRGVEPRRERGGKPFFFEIEQGQKGRNPGPARTKARTKMWETVAGFVVDTKPQKTRRTFPKTVSTPQ